ncbi:TPA: hypothetical protein RZK33_000670 [Campylobacter coli]|nr:hypothetical protein BOQ02_08940 [Campylobacter coli]OOY01393.1 hypothetical protein BOQ02_05965 [Campylobacter coli]HEB9307418.1 hypothetical protein [Campylobacter coli]HEB9321385.1 hypothetical protein [Campylobacter coli]HEB9322566.1 hypothetical protein [Campylobacter coli]
MINGINSYSNYNYTTTLNNNTSNIKSSNVANDNSSLVSDKSQAVNKVLGYGVDEYGFFTSDFNEAAGLPKDYKIYAKSAESFVNFQESDFFHSTHYKVDIAKTIGNAYKVFSQLVPQTSNSSFSAEDLANIPFAFSMDKNYNVTKIYTKDEYENITLTADKINVSFNVWNGSYFENINSENIFNKNGDVNLYKNFYTNTDGSVDKGGVLMAFLNSQKFGATHDLLEGDTKILGKITFDKNISDEEREAFQNFMDKNHIKNTFLENSSIGDTYWDIFSEQLSMQFNILRSQNTGNKELIKLARELAKEHKEMINSNMSLDEFKEKYLDFKQRHDEFVKSLEEAEKAQGIDYSNPLKNINNKETSEEDKEKPFKPIQGESKSETYKDDNKMNELLKKLLENKFSTSDELEILFGAKFSNDDTGEFNKILSLNSAPKSIDIKA